MPAHSLQQQSSRTNVSQCFAAALAVSRDLRCAPVAAALFILRLRSLAL